MSKRNELSQTATKLWEVHRTIPNLMLGALLEGHRQARANGLLRENSTGHTPVISAALSQDGLSKTLERAIRALQDVQHEIDMLSTGVRRYGVRHYGEYGDGSLHWVVLDRVEDETEEQAWDRGHEWAENQGWVQYYGGPGRVFSDDASVHVSRTRILVTQSRGLDV